jgi:CDP-6-deoxy-D-xylo-4-hexulose-3-dehydrase
MISLINDTINKNDVEELIDWLKTNPRLTKGPLTKEFEKLWASWLGSKYSVFVNSGSSANLLMLYTMIESARIKNRKIAIPNLCWATDLAPAIQLGYEPILVDCNLDNLSVDLEHLEKIFIEESPSVLLFVSVLGLVPDMDKIVDLCKKYDVILLEDNCESMGSKYKDSHLGTFGLMSTFSTYFGHHISTIEGGMVCTDDEEIYNLLLSIRSHGWDRDWDKDEQTKIREKNDISEFDALYTFYFAGMNLRSTDLQAFLGINQLKKINNIFIKRNRNYKLYQKYLSNDFWKPKELENVFTSNFAYPIIDEKRNEIIKVLQQNSVEVRPLICGSMHSQPFFRNKLKQPVNDFTNTTKINKFGLYLPNHPDLTEQNIKFICDLINEVK